MYTINIYTLFKYKSNFGRMGMRDRAHKTKVKNKNKISHLGGPHQHDMVREYF